MDFNFTESMAMLRDSAREFADNTSAVGAALYATVGRGTPQQRTLRREANTNAGTFNQSDLPVHFGLATSQPVRRSIPAARMCSATWSRASRSKPRRICSPR